MASKKNREIYRLIPLLEGEDDIPAARGHFYTIHLNTKNLAAKHNITNIKNFRLMKYNRVLRKHVTYFAKKVSS